MSGPSLETRKRWREQVARFIAEHGVEWSLDTIGYLDRATPAPNVHTGANVSYSGKTRGLALAHGYRAFSAHIWHGRAGVNVRKARAAARALLPLADEQAVFEDWTRARRLGPENREPGAFMPFDIYMSEAEVRAMRIDARPMSPGGWPGKLAREWPGDSRAPMGRSLARLGQRVLDMLEGQPDECERCEGKGSFWWDGEDAHPPGIVECPDCHGTGDNLRGYLPEVEETAQEREGRRRAVRDRTPGPDRSWLPGLVVTLGDSSGSSLDDRITRRLWRAQWGGRLYPSAPRWWRGGMTTHRRQQVRR